MDTDVSVQTFIENEFGACVGSLTAILVSSHSHKKCR